MIQKMHHQMRLPLGFGMSACGSAHHAFTYITPLPRGTVGEARPPLLGPSALESRRCMARSGEDLGLPRILTNGSQRGPSRLCLPLRSLAAR